MHIKFYVILFVIINCALCEKQSFFLPNSDRSFHKPSFFPFRTGIVQLFHWPFKAIARECETFLGPKGYAAVQTSPIHENRIIRGRPWYEIYQPISYIINTRLGNELDFKDMIKRCTKSGIRIIVDVIPNHMSDVGDTLVIKGKAGSLAIPRFRLYPAVPYTVYDFHQQCFVEDWNNKTQYQNCELLTLPDLDQSRPNVRIQLAKMLNYLIDLGVAGFRIDAASFMNPDDLKIIYRKLKNLNTKYYFPSNTPPFIYQEAHVWKQDYTSMGRIIEFDFAFFLTRAMRGIYPLKNYHDIGTKWGMVNSDNAVVDNDNHDSQRSYDQVTYREPIQFKMVTAFMLAFPYGIPKMISSFAYDKIIDGPPMDENEDIIDPAPNDELCTANWRCEHRWKGIPEMVKFANVVKDQPVKSYWGNDNGHAAFCRGNKGFIAFNTGTVNLNLELDVCIPPGIYCDVVTGYIDTSDACNKKCTGKTVTVTKERKAQIIIGAMDKQRFLAIHTDSLLSLLPETKGAL